MSINQPQPRMRLHNGQSKLRHFGWYPRAQLQPNPEPSGSFGPIRLLNHPIDTLFWPQIIVLAWYCQSELHILGRIWRKKHSFQLGS
jgi:hypothetical protein